MKALVTGGQGFIGSHLVDKLVDLGFDVTVIDNQSSVCNHEFYTNPKAHYVNQDVADPTTRVFYHGQDYVFHLAAHARIQPALQNPIECVTTNVLGTTNVLQFSREMGVKKVILSSTSSSYGKNKPPLDEAMIPDPLNPYSVSKIAGESLAKMYKELFKLDTVCLRYFNVYGDRQALKGQYAPVIGLFLEQWKAGKPLTIVGDGEQRRDFTHVDDVVRANIACMYSHCPPVLNIGTGTNHSINEIAAMISDDVEFIPPRPAECRETLAKIDRAKYFLDWEPKNQIEDYINEYKVQYENGRRTEEPVPEM